MHTLTAVESTAHPKLRPGWAKPHVPCGYDELVCVQYGATFRLDFLNRKRRDFASRLLNFVVGSPWADGYLPHPHEWRSIGIDVVDATQDGIDKSRSFQRSYFEDGCLCVLSGALPKAAAALADSAVWIYYVEQCKCSRHPERAYRLSVSHAHAA